MKVLYDPECESLARHFLMGVTNAGESEVQELAKAIQLAMEDWLDNFENPEAEAEEGGEVE